MNRSCLTFPTIPADPSEQSLIWRYDLPDTSDFICSREECDNLEKDSGFSGKTVEMDLYWELQSVEALKFRQFFRVQILFAHLFFISLAHTAHTFLCHVYTHPLPGFLSVEFSYVCVHSTSSPLSLYRWRYYIRNHLLRNWGSFFLDLKKFTLRNCALSDQGRHKD